MKNNLLKIVAVAAITMLLGAGVSFADGWKNEKPGHAYGHHKHGAHHHSHYAAPRPNYIEHHYRPVAVERHYYPAPACYAAPAPSGFFFGISVADAGSAFGFGVSGR
jgi:hypothetical protein